MVKENIVDQGFKYMDRVWIVVCGIVIYFALRLLTGCGDKPLFEQPQCMINNISSVVDKVVKFFIDLYDWFKFQVKYFFGDGK
jgi:hypothetical protein